MLNEVEVFLGEMNKMKNSTSVEKSSATLERIAWELNKYLTVESLKAARPGLFRSLFTRTCLGHVRSLVDVKETRTLTHKVDTMRNQAVGGDWF